MRLTLGRAFMWGALGTLAASVIAVPLGHSLGWIGYYVPSVRGTLREVLQLEMRGLACFALLHTPALGLLYLISGNRWHVPRMAAASLGVVVALAPALLFSGRESVFDVVRLYLNAPSLFLVIWVPLLIGGALFGWYIFEREAVKVPFMRPLLYRAVLMAGVAWTLGVVAFVYRSTPYVALQFADEPHNRKPLALTGRPCAGPDVEFEYITRDIGGGRIIGVGLCMAHDRSHWFPGREPSPMTLRVAAEQTAAAFVLPDDARRLANDIWRQKRSEQASTATTLAACGWSLLIAITAWIPVVRLVAF